MGLLHRIQVIPLRYQPETQDRQAVALLHVEQPMAALQAVHFPALRQVAAEVQAGLIIAKICATSDAILKRV